MPGSANDHDYIFDWNRLKKVAPLSQKKFELNDETLRDGLQSPSVTDPTIEQKIRLVHLMESLGITSADIGLPGAGPHVQKTVERLAREIVEQKLSVYPSAAGRTHENDIKPIVEISQRVGIAIEADLFIGSSPIRQFAEEWDLDWIIEQSAKAVRFAVGQGIPVMYVTEDTTRAKPEDIEKLYTAAIDAGAARICIADTVGHATPWGTRNVVRFVRALVDRLNPDVKVDWHGHEDRGMGVINCIAAHHDDVPHESEVSVLVQAADAISGSRPGARREAFETYVKRLEGLEKIAASYKGVDRVFAIQAGREVRVIVNPETVDDNRMQSLTEEIARRVESELQYPGQIKVVAIREMRSSNIAR